MTEHSAPEIRLTLKQGLAALGPIALPKNAEELFDGFLQLLQKVGSPGTELEFAL